MNELALFAGAGGGLLATHHLLGWRCVGYVEMAEYPCKVLEARINDGLLSKAPIFQMHTRDFIKQGWPEKYRGLVDVVTAGFPCQPFCSGGRRAGHNDERNAWPDTIRIIDKVKPQWVFLENSPKLLSPFRKRKCPAYFNTILRDLATIGYDARWGCLSASTLGAEHKRKRLWIAAYPSSQGRPIVLRSHQANSTGADRNSQTRWIEKTNSLGAILNRIARLEERLGEPSIFGTNDGLAHRVDRLEAAGQGQFPAVAAEAWRLMK